MHPIPIYIILRQWKYNLWTCATFTKSMQTENPILAIIKFDTLLYVLLLGPYFESVFHTEFLRHLLETYYYSFCLGPCNIDIYHVPKTNDSLLW